MRQSVVRSAGYATEIKKFTANVNDSYYTPTVKNYKVLAARNLSSKYPIEISLGNFPEPDERGIIDKSTYSNVLRILPGEFKKVYAEPTTIGYRSTASLVEVEFILGADVDLSHGKNGSFFSDLQTESRILLAIGRRQNKLFRHVANRIFMSEDNGQTWVQKHHFTTPLNPESGYVTATGTLLVAMNDDTLLRSTNDGETFTEVLSGLNRAWRRGPGIAENQQTGVIMFAENQQTDNDSVIWRSTDDGVNWAASLTRTREQVRHWHSIQVDPYTGDWLAFSGDNDGEIEWWKSTDDGLNWTNMEVPSVQDYRILGVFFTEDYYIWGSDADNGWYGRASILKAPKNNVATSTKTMTLSGPVLGLYQDNELWLLAVSPHGGPAIHDNTKLLASINQGETWEEVLSWAGERGIFSLFPFPDMYGNIYALLGGSAVGIWVAPWNYGTLKMTR